MTDTISGANQKAGNVTPKKAIDSNRPQAGTPVGNNISTGAVSGDSSVELSAKLKEEIAAVGFDNAKVNQIKNSIEQGDYPLDDKKIADSFIPLEKLL